MFRATATRRFHATYHSTHFHRQSRGRTSLIPARATRIRPSLALRPCLFSRRAARGAPGGSNHHPLVSARRDIITRRGRDVAPVLSTGRKIRHAIAFSPPTAPAGHRRLHKPPRPPRPQTHLRHRTGRTGQRPEPEHRQQLAVVPYRQQCRGAGNSTASAFTPARSLRIALASNSAISLCGSI